MQVDVSRMNQDKKILVHSTHIYLPMKMEQTECSETSAHKLHTPGNYPKEIRTGRKIEIKKSLTVPLLECDDACLYCQVCTCICAWPDLHNIQVIFLFHTSSVWGCCAQHTSFTL